jgi:uncharacterized protein (TIGR02391 family)
MTIDPTNPDLFMRHYLRCLHPYISSCSSALFEDEHYSQAAGEATKAVFQYLRDRTGLDADGTRLAQQAFSEKAPILVFSDLGTETKKNEQVGFMEMLVGYAKGIRNPLAHSLGGAQKERTAAMREAFEYLVLASLLCRRIDESHDAELDKTSHPSGQETFRGERTPCVFEINPRYTEVSGRRWKDHADLAVSIIKSRVKAPRVFLIPSGAAPSEYADPNWWKDNKTLLTEKHQIVNEFASTNTGTLSRIHR